MIVDRQGEVYIISWMHKKFRDNLRKWLLTALADGMTFPIGDPAEAADLLNRCRYIPLEFYNVKSGRASQATVLQNASKIRG